MTIFNSGLVDGRDVFQGVGADEQAGEEEGIVADVNEIRGENGAGARASEGEDYADENQQGDLQEAAPELRGVHESKKYASDDNAGGYAPFARENRIEEAAEENFFEKWSEGDAKRGEPKHVGAGGE